MSRSSKLISVLAAFLFLPNMACLGQGQSVNSFLGRATSCSDESCRLVIAIVSRSGLPPPPPTIQYLPGTDGQTIMVADFPGILWPIAPKIIRRESGAGIEEIRAGQFQESPAVCRISFTTRTPLFFKGVSFESSSNSIVIQWNNDLTALRAQTSNSPSGATRSSLRSASTSRPLPSGRSPREYPVRASVQPVPSAPYAPVRTVAAAEPRLPQAAPEPPAALHPHPLIDPNRIGPARSEPAVTARVDVNTLAGSPNGKQSDDFSRSSKGAPSKNVNAKSKRADNELAAVEESRHNRSLLHKLFSRLSREDEQVHKDQALDQKLTQAESGAYSTSHAAATIGKESLAQPADNQSRVAVMPPSELSNYNKQSLPMNALQNKATNNEAVRTVDGESKPVSEPAVKEPARATSIKMIADEMAVDDSLKIQIAAPRKISYRAFRVHNPERFVIDFENFAELTNVEPPDSDSPLLYEIRTGRLTDRPNTTRVVLDLPDADVAVYEELNSSADLLSLTLLRKAAAWSIPHNGPLRTPGTAVIVIDAGHGGSDPGAQRGSVQEKEITLSIAGKLREVLERQGVHIVMTRSDDATVSLEDRVRITNQTVPDLFVSVHINAMETGSDVHGIETYYLSEQSRSLADSIHQNLITALNAPDRSVRKARFYVINHTSVPAVLAEVGFISNPLERAKLVTAEYQNQVAQALAQGVMLYLTHTPGTARLGRPAAEGLKLTGTTPQVPKSTDDSLAHSNSSNTH